jgi:leader peptidase (prepilin peptidase)/N-methyltransferase
MPVPDAALVSALWATGTLLTAGLAAPVLAGLSLHLPGAEGRVSRRAAAFAAGLAFLAAWAWAVTPGPLAFVSTVLAGWLLLIAVLDAEHFWLPDVLTLPLGVAGLIVAAATAPGELTERGLGVVVGFAVLAGLASLYARLRGRQGLGGGDARLLAAIGAWVGWQGLPSVLLIGAVTGLLTVGVLALRGQRPRADARLPFGTFLAAGAWITWLYGPIGL